MPYITGHQREYLSPGIEETARQIRSFGPGVRAGGLNYAISKIIKDVYGSGLKYSDYNEIIGVLECCKLEFYRAQVAPYEEVKRKENGDV